MLIVIVAVAVAVAIIVTLKNTPSTPSSTPSSTNGLVKPPSTPSTPSSSPLDNYQKDDLPSNLKEFPFYFNLPKNTVEDCAKYCDNGRGCLYCTNFLYDNQNQMCYLSGDKCKNNKPQPQIFNISNNVVHYTKKI